MVVVVLITRSLHGYRDTPDCRVMAFTSDGALLAFVDSTGYEVTAVMNILYSHSLA